MSRRRSRPSPARTPVRQAREAGAARRGRRIRHQSRSRRSEQNSAWSQVGTSRFWLQRDTVTITVSGPGPQSDCEIYRDLPRRGGEQRLLPAVSESSTGWAAYAGQSFFAALVIVGGLLLNQIEKARQIISRASTSTVEILTLEHSPEPQHRTQNIIQM